MPSRNEVRIMGHLGQNAEVKFTPNGIAVTTLNVATTRSWKPDGATEWKQETNWHRVIAWRLDDKVLAVLKKGNLVDIDGRIQTRNYEKDGQKHYVTEIIAAHVYFLREPFKGGGPKDVDAPVERDPSPLSDDDVPW